MSCRPCVVLVTAALLPLAWVPSAAGSDQLERALDLLPRVDAVESDGAGRLTAIEGELTPAGESPPRRAAVAFLTVHAALLGAAEGSSFEVEQVVTSGDETRVMVRQAIDGFRAGGPPLRLRFSRSVLTRFDGPVLGDGDVEPGRGEPLPRERAVALAVASLDGPDDIVAAGARRVIVERRRCWQVELRHEAGGGSDATLVTMNGYDGSVISHQGLVLDAAPGEATPEIAPRSSISGCVAWTPAVGDFTSAAGQQLWTGADVGCGKWQFDPGRGASLLRGNCLEYLCAPYPSTDGCDHGEISRRGLGFAAGYERVRIEALTPDREIFMRLRWGRSELEAAPFIVPRGPVGTTTVELDLAGFPTWHSEQVSALTLELVDDEQIWLRSLDLLPGPWLELPAGPELVPDEPGEPLVAGHPAGVLQDVRNLGCRLDAGTHEEMRSVSYDLYEWLGGTLRFEATVCEGVAIPGAIPAEASVRDLAMCSFDLPGAGSWRLEARFDVHPSPPAATDFAVEPAVAPDLGIDQQTPLDLYSGDLALWPCRSDVLDRDRYGDPDPPCNLPYVVALEAWSAGLAEPVETTITARARPHDPSADPGTCEGGSSGWYALGAPVAWTFTGGASGPIGLPLDQASVLALPLGPDGWAVIDLEVAIAPVAGEIDLANNRVCISSWIPVVDGELASELGPTWVADDYFFPPAHWPPNGLATTGVVLEREGGAATYQPDSSLAVMTVEPGANEPPRVVWFEPLEQRAVSGLLLRYRRAEAGFGGPAFLDAGCAESDELPSFDLAPPGSPNRALLTADSQWRTVAWRRGAAGPFGGFPVPLLIAPASSGDLLSLHLAPDGNCLSAEPGCPGGLHPGTMLDVVAVWHGEGSPGSGPVFEVAGLRARSGAEWVPAPATVVSGESLALGVEVLNVGAASGAAELTAELRISPLGDLPLDLIVSGAATVVIPAGGSSVLALQPPWQPHSIGRYLIAGWVRESGVDIGSVSASVEVMAPTPYCPAPIPSLP